MMLLLLLRDPAIDVDNVFYFSNVTARTDGYDDYAPPSQIDGCVAIFYPPAVGVIVATSTMDSNKNVYKHKMTLTLRILILMGMYRAVSF
jgi:hypothetical protein